MIALDAVGFTAAGGALAPLVYLAMGAFGTFMLFLLLALLALPVTAMLDRAIGKEKALLLYAVGLLALTFFVFTGTTKKKGKSKKAGVVKGIPVSGADLAGDPFTRPTLDLPDDHGRGGELPGEGDRRNIYRQFSDVQDLPAPDLDAPPWHPLDLTMLPTIPGPAPGARWVLRAAKPAFVVATEGAEEEGTAPPSQPLGDIPQAVFSDRVPEPNEVYDWIEGAGGRTYVYISAIKPEGAREYLREGQEGFDDALWAFSKSPGGEVRFSVVGNTEVAKKHVTPEAILLKRRQGVSSRAPKEGEVWRVRETVANRARAAMDRVGLSWSMWRESRDIGALTRAAAAMAEVGKTGQEGEMGWTYAADLLGEALEEARNSGDDVQRSEVLLRLREAYAAMHDEAAHFRTLADYVRANPKRADGWAWTGDLLLERMGEPGEALAYYDRALEHRSSLRDAHLGRARALTRIGRHKEALHAVDQAGRDVAAQRLRATLLLRLGQLDKSITLAQSLIARQSGDLEAVHVRGCVLYTKGDLGGARAVFQRVASDPAADELRAQACYNLGLTCVRLGDAPAARAAFEACDQALSRGASPGPIPDETVSPELGLAFLAWAEGRPDDMSAALDKAREQAPLSSALHMFVGMVRSREQDDDPTTDTTDFASAQRALSRALDLAPNYAELDGWFGRVYMALGEGAAATGASQAEVAEHLDRSMAFLKRAADREEKRDRTAYDMRLRETAARIAASHVPRKQRFQAARRTVDSILRRGDLREQPAALATRGYINFRLGSYDPEAYDQCIRDLQAVVDVVPQTEGEGASPWLGWRAYAAARLADVKRWRDLEEKRLVFEGVALNKDWQTDQSDGPRIRLEEGALVFQGKAKKDGRPNAPTVQAYSAELFTKRSFEEISLELTIPGEINGDYKNNNVFGVQIGSLPTAGGSGRRSSRSAALGVYNDKGKIAVRVGGGKGVGDNEMFKDGNLKRMPGDPPWPSHGPVRVRIVRITDKGLVQLYVEDELIIEEQISGLKRSGGKMNLWIGGYSTMTQPFDVRVTNVRIIRRKGGGR